MMHQIEVHFLPSSVIPEELTGSAAVMLDILRASTTMATAIQNGTREIVPFETVDEVRCFAEQSTREVLTGGERQGVRIEGFDLDNSPFDYTQERVCDRTIAMTTTNGTQALARCSAAHRVVTGSFVNFAATVEALRESPSMVHLVCAGTDGQVSAEDVLCAGAFVAALTESDIYDLASDKALIARDFFRQNAGSPSAFLDCLQSSQGGRNLQRLGFDRDIERAGQWNCANVLVQYDPESRSIRPAQAAVTTNRPWQPDWSLRVP